MSIGEPASIALIIVQLLMTWLYSRTLANIVRIEARSLGNQTSEAIQAAIGTLAGMDLEAPNPIQAAIAQFIQTRLAPSAKAGSMAELTRDEQGKFS